MSKMKKIVASLVLSTVVATGAYANCQKNYKHSSSKMKMPIISKFKQLDLNQNQKHKLMGLIKEFKSNRHLLNDVFKNKSFNKDLYIKTMNEKRENMLKSKAELIQKAYAILNDNQKIKFEELINKNK